MTAEPDVAADLFGLADTFPRPGWVVLDAARDHRFTGELIFDTSVEARVYFDRGRIYLAERSSDPSLGSRLVDAGALNAAQLEHGSLRIGDSEHLGRLFERVPSIDRHSVLVTAEMMTEECVGWLAGQQIRAVRSSAYRHHPSGVHRWERPNGWADLSPGDPLPAPAPDEVPVEVVPPEPLFAPVDSFDDGMIQWDEPGWLDERSRPEGVRPAVGSTGMAQPPAGAPSPSPETAELPAAPVSSEPAAALSISADWIERLAWAGLPEPGSDPLTPAKRLPSLTVEPLDRFELIWPSGEVDEQFGASDTAPPGDRHPDLDRAGPTALVHRPSSAPDPLGEPPVVHVAPEDEVTDEVVLAVRRAVASIETGSLAARRRLADAPTGEAVRGVDLVPPGRVAVRDDLRVRSSPGAARSVFDEPVTTPSDDDGVAEPVRDQPTERLGALRRLIAGLRRR